MQTSDKQGYTSTQVVDPYKRMENACRQVKTCK